MHAPRILHLSAFIQQFVAVYVLQVWPGLVSDAVRGDGGEGGEGGGTSDPLLSLEAQLKVQQICANIINYCRTAMTMGGKGQLQA